MRDDLSSKLIHFTKGDDQAATDTFLKIINERRLRGGRGYIKGGYSCICFTEAPIGKLAHILANREMYNFDYAPFGVMIEKLWLWQQGGRPVIYQSDDEYELLREEQRYRHKRYEPENGIDFTWEREWRIKAEVLKLDPQQTTLIVPTRKVVDFLTGEHFNAIKHNVRMMGKDGLMYMDRYPWHFIVLEDLGILEER